SRLCLQKFGIASIPLLYCMRCELCWFDFIYELETDKSIAIVKAHHGAVTEEWSDEVGLDEFPEQPVALLRIPIEVEDLFDKLNTNTDLSDEEEAEIVAFTENYANPEVGGYPIVDVINQIGGRSFLSQRLDNPTCDGCQNTMVFFASLTNDRRRR